MAWLQTPVRHGRSNRMGESRAVRMAADKVELPLPAVKQGAYLLGYLLEVGPVFGGGTERTPITFSELQAWQHLVGVHLRPWECRMLRRLSRDYLTQSAEASSRSCPAPWTPPAEANRKRVAAQVGSIFGNLVRRKGKPS